MTKRLFTVPDVADRFGVTNQTVRNWIASGRLSAVQPTRRGRFRIPVDALDAFERNAAVQGRRAEDIAARRTALEAASPAARRSEATASSNADTELERIIRAIVAAVHPDAVYLFGSRARGDARPDSDFDLALVAPDGTPRRRTAMRAYEGIAAVADRTVGVDIVVLTPAIITAERDLAGSIAQTVAREGVPVYGSAALA